MLKTLHLRNFHNDRYDFKALIKTNPDLQEFVKPNKYGDLSIDFANPQAVISLNKALLAYFYGIKNYTIPNGYLCPPIPGRADYVHHIADLLASCNNGVIPKGKAVIGLDVGIGANGIYSIIGSSVYDWNFVGSDIEIESIKSVENIVNSNEILKEKIECKLQTNPENIFTGIIKADEFYDFTLCNPPFHKSLKDAMDGNKRKVQNLTKQKTIKNALNFGGKNNELWCKGGEIVFITNMIKESFEFKTNVLWFTTLVSKKENLPLIYKKLEDIKAKEIKTINMSCGQKITRVVAWSFFNNEEQKKYFKLK
ncbi:MAG: 23S rRNA (adenine(1618)-N(6))-methyltransferase RlmF [Aliarcobacter sp.]|jgi:23S rRNA (adenine1618-N6)-methyltransferase|nr:23S rRNA (adenine(1618)-N(6))-methyltransferase RlmF [Aliarcobacter sp.]